VEIDFYITANDSDTLAIILRRSLPRISGAQDDSPHTLFTASLT